MRPTYCFRLVPLLLALLCSGCAEKGKPVTVGQAAEQIGAAYDLALTQVIDSYFDKRLDDELEHKNALHAFVTMLYPKATYIRDVLEGEDDLPEGDLETISDRIVSGSTEAAIHYCKNNAMSVFLLAVSLYERLHINPDAVISELYSMDVSQAYWWYIASVREQSTMENFREQYPESDFDFEKNDRVFNFGGKDAAWQQRHGWDGFIIVRSNRILLCLITAIN